MAMTACAAKFSTSSICLSVNGLTSCPIDGDHADQLVFLEHRHDEQCPLAAEFNPGNRQRIVSKIGLIDTKVGDVDALAGFSDTVDRAKRAGPMSPTL